MKVGGQILWNVTHLSAKTSQIYYLMGRRPMKDVLGNHLKDRSNPSIWKESLTWFVPRFALYAGGLWKGDVLVADLEELETMDASEIHSKRLNAK